MIDRIISLVREQRRPAWLVGGYVRDQRLRRETHDLDIVVPEGGIRLTRQLADAFGGVSFVLDAERDVGRAIVPVPGNGHIEIDAARLRVPDLIDDLALRDFTVNAMAMDMATEELPIFDPFDGRADVDRRLLRAVTEGAFVDDPLRMLRGVRMVAELGFRIEGASFNLMRRDASLLPTVSPERVREELMRIVTAPGGWRHLRLLSELALLPYVLPEAAAQVGVTQSSPHYQDVFDHSRSVLAHLHGIIGLLWPDGPYRIPAQGEDDLTVIAGAGQWEDLRSLLAPYVPDLQAHLCLPLSAGRTRRDLLSWAALCHDWGKPAKRMVDEGDRVRFFDHDHWGALLAEARLSALRFSGDEISYVARLTDLHMRPGELAHSYPYSRRAEYRFFRAADNTAPDIVLLSLADHMATYAPAPDGERWQTRLKISEDLLHAFFRERQVRVTPAPLLNGRELMAALGIEPGPAVGDLLEALREAQATGEVQSADEALAWLQQKVAS